MQLLCLAGSEEKSHPQANLKARYYNQTLYSELLKEVAFHRQSKNMSIIMRIMFPVRCFFHTQNHGVKKQ